MSKPTVVIVGGGVAGAATAFALAQRQVAVTVIDSAQVGQATAAGAGILEPWSTGLEGPPYELYAAGAAYYPTLLAALEDAGVTDIGYRVAGLPDRRRRSRCSWTRSRSGSGSGRPGSPWRAKSRDWASGRRTSCSRRWRRVCRACTSPEVLGSTVADCWPGCSTPPGVSARTSGPAMRASHRTRTARVSYASTTRCSPRRPSWSRPAPGRTRCCSPWACSVPVAPQRGQLIHLCLEGVETTDWPTVLPPADNYVVPFEAGRIVVGATRETGSGFDARITADGLREVLESALAIAPGLASATVLETRVGLRPSTAAEAPYVGAVPGVARLFVNAGFGAAGLTMGPVVGAALAGTILDEQPQFDRTPFAPPRGVCRHRPPRGRHDCPMTRPAPGTSSGSSLPRGADGRRSSSALGRETVAAALGGVDPVGAAAAERETNWRSGYPGHFRRLVEAGLADRSAALTIAEGGAGGGRRPDAPPSRRTASRPR